MIIDIEIFITNKKKKKKRTDIFIKLISNV